jgi:hypothetical protein
MSDAITYVSDDTFDAEVLQSTTPVLVDYWAEWCGPCKMIAPILDDVAKEYAGKLKVAKLKIRRPRRSTASAEFRRSCCSKTAAWQRPKSVRCPNRNWLRLLILIFSH